MSLIIALVGIIVYYIIYSCLNNKKESVQRKTQAQINASSIVFNKWRKEVIDVDLENKVTHTPLIYHTDREYEELITSVIHSIPSLNKEFGDEYGYLRFFKLHVVWCYRIIMASSGKLLLNDALNGIRSPDVYDSERKKDWRMNHDLMKWMDLQLKNHGVNHEMYFVTGNNLQSCRFDHNLLIPINDVKDEIGGRYCWLFMVHNLPIY